MRQPCTLCGIPAKARGLCSTHYGRARDHGTLPPQPPEPMLDAGPLLAMVDRCGGTTQVLHAAGIDGASDEGRRWRDAFRRLRRNGQVSLWLADRICVRLFGTLPELVYGDEFFAGCEEVAA